MNISSEGTDDFSTDEILIAKEMELTQSQLKDLVKLEFDPSRLKALNLNKDQIFHFFIDAGRLSRENLFDEYGIMYASISEDFSDTDAIIAKEMNLTNYQIMRLIENGLTPSSFKELNFDENHLKEHLMPTVHESLFGGHYSETKYSDLPEYDWDSRSDD